jgi:hypothetical protein
MLSIDELLVLPPGHFDVARICDDYIVTAVHWKDIISFLVEAS